MPKRRRPFAQDPLQASKAAAAGEPSPSRARAHTTVQGYVPLALAASVALQTHLPILRNVTALTSFVCVWPCCSRARHHFCFYGVLSLLSRAGLCTIECTACRTTEQSATWSARVVQNEGLLVSGAAEIKVISGHVECWGARLAPGDAHLVATSSAEAALSLRAVPALAQGLARLATADVAIHAVSKHCHVGSSLADVGAQHDESTCPDAWSEVCCSRRSCGRAGLLPRRNAAELVTAKQSHAQRALGSCLRHVVRRPWQACRQCSSCVTPIRPWRRSGASCAAQKTLERALSRSASATSCCSTKV